MKPTNPSPRAVLHAALLLFLVLTTGALAQAPVTFVTEDFDPSGEGVTYTSSTFDDGGSDYFERTTSNPDPRQLGAYTFTAPQGGSYWTSEDIGNPTFPDASNPLGTHGIVRLNNINVAGFNNLKVRVFLAQTDDRFDIDDVLEIQAAIDGNLPASPTNLTQGSYTTVGRFIGNLADIFGSADMKQDADLDGTVFSDPSDAGSPVLTPTLTEYTFNIPFTGNTLSVQYRLQQDGGSEELSIDHIRVEGTPSANNAPVLAAIEGTTIAYAEGDPATQVTNTITVADADAPTDMIESAVIQITANNDPTEDVLAASPPAGITAAPYVAATGTLTLSGTASVANYQAALRSVTYQNTDAVNPTLNTRTVQFQVNDGTDGSNIQTRNIAVSGFVPLGSVPHTETFNTDGEGARYTSSTYRNGGQDFFERSTTNPASGHSAPFTFTSPQGGAFWAMEDIDSLGNPLGDHGIVRLQNLDATGLSNIKIRLYLAETLPEGEGPEDKIEIQYAFDGDIPSSSTDLTSGSYTTVGRFVPDSVDIFNEGPMTLDRDLDGVTFGDAVDDAPSETLTPSLQEFVFDVPATGSTLSVRVRVQQNGGAEEIAFDRVQVTGDLVLGTPPVLANIEAGTINYTESDPATQITNAITVADPDVSAIASATVQITDGYAMGQDVLADNGSVPGGITVGAFNAGTATLELTGNASVSDYQTALRAVTYVNTNGPNPAPGTRTVSFQATDGDANPSNIETRDIQVAATIAPDVIPFLVTFDTDENGVRYTSSSYNTGGLNSFFERVTANPDSRHNAGGFSGFTFTPPQGGAYFASEDIEEVGNPLGDHGIIRLPDLATGGAPDLKVRVFLAQTADTFDIEDKIEVQYAYDGNSGGADLTAGTYTTIGRFIGDTDDVFNTNGTGDMKQDADLDGVVFGDGDDATSPTLSTTMQEFEFTIPATGSLLSLQLRVEQNGGSEELAFDHFQVVSPEIDVQRPLANSIPDGGTDDLGNVSPGIQNLSYTIENLGTDDLEVSATLASSAVNVSSLNTTTGLPLVIAPGATANLDVQVEVDTFGPFSVVLEITNTDFDESPYDIQIFGEALTSLEFWRIDNFTTAELANPALEATLWGNGANPDKDANLNIFEFIHDLDPQVFETSPAIIIGRSAAKTTWSFQQRDDLTGITFDFRASSLPGSGFSSLGAPATSTPSGTPGVSDVTYEDTVDVTPGTTRVGKIVAD